MSHNLFRIYKIIFSLILFTLSVLVINKPSFALQCDPWRDDPLPISQIVCPFVRIINLGIMLSGAALTIMVLYGGIKLAMAMGDPKGFQAAKGTMTWALIGFLVVIFSITILTLIKNIFDLNIDINPFDSISQNIQELLDMTKKPTSP